MSRGTARPGRGWRRAVAVRSALARGARGSRISLVSQPVLAAGLVLLSVLVAVGMAVAPDWFPPAGLLLVLLGAVTVLRQRALWVLTVAIVAEVVVLELAGFVLLGPGWVVVLLLALGLAMLFVRSREGLGLQGAPSQLMLVDLRDRLAAQGQIPVLPQGWQVESVIRSAHGDGFSGDFVVAAKPSDDLLEIVLVDVSGKGQAAGVRSLLLSGAFGGLLGALPPEDFLPAANTYLIQQHWGEGFATAVHLTVDLASGEYSVVRAGHPPQIHLHAGSGQVEVAAMSGGPVLGVTRDPSYPSHTDVLEPGDSLVLYTDGLVEDPRRGLDQGIDRLTGVVESLLARGRGGATDMLDALRTGEGDDRALVLVHRR